MDMYEDDLNAFEEEQVFRDREFESDLFCGVAEEDEADS